MAPLPLPTAEPPQVREPTLKHTPPAAPALNSMASSDFGYQIGEFVCLPGTQAAESDYIASLLRKISESSEENASAAPPASPSEPPAVAKPTKPEVLFLDEPAPLESPVAEDATEVVTSQQDRVISDQLPGDDPTALWEVDQFLYPAVTDRLIREYAYFAQSGEKLRQAAEAGLKVLAITGLGRDEGRTTLAICLARSAAAVGLKVGLVDCDFSKPMLANELGLDLSAGWESVASGKRSLPEVAVRSCADDVLLLPLVDDPGNASLSLKHEWVASTIAELAAALDLLILDMGPLDPALLSAESVPFNAALVVWDRRHRPMEEAQSAARTLNTLGVEAVGIAENFSAAAAKAA
jgi:Mrp family chromosome partitioning ATPase